MKLQRAYQLEDDPDNDHLLERSFLLFKDAFEEAEEREKVHSTHILSWFFAHKLSTHQKFAVWSDNCAYNVPKMARRG